MAIAAAQQGIGADERRQAGARGSMPKTLDGSADRMMSEDSSMMRVLSVLRTQGGKMSPHAIAHASGLDDAVVDTALQSLLIRRLVACRSHKKPGRGGQDRPTHR
jgi:hypothetical protein